MPKPDKQIIIDAIIKEIEKGKDRGKLLATIGKKWQLSQRTFDRYWKIANQQHTLKQQAIKKELAAIDTQAAIDARKKAIMSADERKEYLTKLIIGQIKVPYSEVKWNSKTQKFQTIKFQELAGHQARISAIAELNRMEGDYAETAFRIRGDKDNPLHTKNTIDDSQFQQLLTAARESKTSSGQ